MEEHSVDAWLINTGWNGRAYGSGRSRIELKHTRAIIDAIHSGSLKEEECTTYPTFNLQIPLKCVGVPDEILDPRKVWEGDQSSCEMAVKKLASRFIAYLTNWNTFLFDIIGTLNSTKQSLEMLSSLGRTCKGDKLYCMKANLRMNKVTSTKHSSFSSCVYRVD